MEPHAPPAPFSLHPALALLAALVLALAGCTGDDCARRAAWRNEQSPACQTCQSASCADEFNAVGRTPMACQVEYACIARCPASGALTCGCIDACLVTPRCREAYDTLVACIVRRCDAECQTGNVPARDAGGPNG
jgi:hypothetical protein